ncbi:MAG: hypothetical protein U9R42_12495 [Bacteroidota bacterium]|nr:hypothetical protein [Bacteroidota bacterium]
MKKILTYLIFSTLIITSCDIINPEEEIPSYIHIDKISLSGSYDSFGSMSHNIVDAWVFLDNKKFIGAFELPVTIPILEKGEHTINIQGGIKENGITNTRVPYPFYKTYNKTLTLSQAIIDTLSPVIRYKSDGFVMTFNEDFENPESSFEKTDRNSVDYKRSTENIFEKNYSLSAKIINKGDIFEMQTVNIFKVPRGKAIFMEMNYKTTIMLTIGYFSINASDKIQHGFFKLNPSEEWNKIYINMGSEIAFEPFNNVFRFFIGAIKNTEGDTASVYLDNIKLLSLE